MLLLSSVASAAPAGDVFSGAVQPGGHSFFWNPASLAPATPGGGLFVSAGAVVLDVDYRRSGIDPSSGQPFNDADGGIVGPDIGFSFIWTSPWPWLSLIAGNWGPRNLAARWEEDGSQRYANTFGMMLSHTVEVGVLLKPHPRFAASLTAGPVFSLDRLQYALDFGALANQVVAAPLFPREHPSLQGQCDIQVQGWSAMFSLGLWGQPFEWWQAGVSVRLPTAPRLQGEAEVSIPAIVNQQLPTSQQLAVRGSVELSHPLPWQLCLESQFTGGRFSLAFIVLFIRKQKEALLSGIVTLQQPMALSSRILFPMGARDDLQLAVRAAYRLRDDLQVALRFDYSPQHIANEVANAAILDFAMYEIGAGLQWRFAPRVTVAFSYVYVLTKDVNVVNSVYSPYAPLESGLFQPSSNGIYTSSLHRVHLSANFLFAHPRAR